MKRTLITWHRRSKITSYITSHHITSHHTWHHITCRLRGLLPSTVSACELSPLELHPTLTSRWARGRRCKSHLFFSSCIPIIFDSSCLTCLQSRSPETRLRRERVHFAILELGLHVLSQQQLAALRLQWQQLDMLRWKHLCHVSSSRIWGCWKTVIGITSHIASHKVEDHPYVTTNKTRVSIKRRCSE